MTAVTWKDKMNRLVKDVLGSDYYVWVEDEHRYKIFFEGNQVSVTDTAFDISAHWKGEAKRIILFIIENKIIESIRKLEY